MNYKVLYSQKEFEEIIERHNRESEHVVMDLETTGLDSFKDKILEVQVNGFTEDMVFIADGSLAHCLRKLRAKPVGHNLRFDITFLYRAGIDVTHWQYHDTMILGHLLDENRESYSLDSYAKELWNANYKEEFWSKYKNYQDAPKEAAWEYGARDIIYTRKLYRSLTAALERDSIPYSLITHVHRLQYSLLRTEIQGVKVDVDYLTGLGVSLKSQIEILKPKMRALVEDYVDLAELEAWSEEISKRKTDKGRAAVPRPTFSFDSSKQLQTLLYTHMGLPPQRNEKTKAISVDDASLEKLKDHHAIIPLLQEYRGAHKVYGTYIEGTLERMRDGTIYPEFRVTGTVTGRISHSNPNLGQLPKSGGIRGIYRAQEGHAFISADYSQLEVNIEANITGDAALAKIFTEGLSKHDVTAKELGIHRDQAKTLNFCLQYFGTHFKVAKLLGVTEREALSIWNQYWNVYRGPKALKGRTDKLVDAGSAVVTAFGRKRRFLQRQRSPWDGDYRQAYNFLIQGTGADITSRAFYLVSDWLRETGYGRGLFTVHDEILIEVKEEHFPECEQKLLSTMVAVGEELGLKIPLKAESSGLMRRWED